MTEPTEEQIRKLREEVCSRCLNNGQCMYQNNDKHIGTDEWDLRDAVTKERIFMCEKRKGVLK